MSNSLKSGTSDGIPNNRLEGSYKTFSGNLLEKRGKKFVEKPRKEFLEEFRMEFLWSSRRGTISNL